MFYKVKKETCGKGIKEKYNVGQIIDELEVNKIKNNFNNYFYTYYDTRTELKLEYFSNGIFNQKEFIYSILLEKNCNFKII